MNTPPREHVRRAMQVAMSGVIERLAQMSAGGSNKRQGGPGARPNIPMSIARAFSQVLCNENLRRGVSENMLSVYVPPGP